MKQALFILLSISLLQSCKNSSSEQKKVSVGQENVKVAIGNVQAYRPNIDLTPWEGDLHDAVYWTDTSGEHAIIISGKSQYFWEDENPSLKSKLKADQDPEINSEVAEIFASHFVLPKGGTAWKLAYNYSDRIFGCCDVWMEYQKSSLQVVDVDSNGTGEVVFMYHTTEADGKIVNLWQCHLVLLQDTSTFVSEGYSGYETGVKDVENHYAPESGIYRTYVENEFSTLKSAWIALLQEEEKMLRQAPVEEDAHDHDSHNH